MNPEPTTETLGAELAHEAVEQVLAHADHYCEHEKQRIAAANDSKIVALNAELANLRDEELDLKERIHRAPPIGDIRTRRRKARYYWAITVVLMLAGFFFSLLAFDPYRLGWKSYLYCLGIAVVTPFCIEKFLETWASARLMKSLAALACTTALSSLVLLAVVRGDVLGQQIKASSVAVLIGDNGTPAAPQSGTDFYDKTLLLLRCVMGLLAVAMEIGAGVALYEARKLGSEGEDPIELSKCFKELREKIASRESELALLEKEPVVFANRFWRDFHRAILNGAARRAAAKAALVLLVIGLVSNSHAFGADRANLVVALDLTKSVAVKGADGRSEFEKNVAAVGGVLAHAPAGARITVVGITEASFAQPSILLSAELAADEGYFREKLAAGRRELLHTWQERSKALEARSPHTDILGALLVASELFREAPNKKDILVIFSDMRQDMPKMNLERPTVVPASAMKTVEKVSPLPNLAGVEVYVLGVDGAGREVAYWESLHSFWTGYFRKTGATLKAYSILRDPPQLEP